jgi:hypothetical protein
MAPVGTVICLNGEYHGAWLKINNDTKTPMNLMVKHFCDANDAIYILRLVAQYIPDTLMDGDISVRERALELTRASNASDNRAGEASSGSSPCSTVL